MFDHAKKDFSHHGISVTGDIKMDVAAMMSFKNKTVKGLTGGIEGLFKKYKVCHIIDNEHFISFLSLLIGGLR